MIGPEKTGTPLESVESSVRAILVKLDGSGGAVKVYGAKVRHVVSVRDGWIEIGSGSINPLIHA